MKVKALIRQEQSAGYSVSVPALPGCHSEGETREEALANIKEVAELWMEVTTTAWDRVLQYSDEPQAAAKYLLKLGSRPRIAGGSRNWLPKRVLGR
jgi:predicted RNase H-like HicB family nuclease